MTMEKTELKKTPLYARHCELEAKMVPFAGWSMPVSYTDGIISEHLHTRRKAGLFDICHMGELLLMGPKASEDLGRLFTADIDGLAEGAARYGFLLNEEGCFLDDLIVFRRGRDEYMLVVNAACVEKDREWVGEHISSETNLEDISGGTGKIDLQGPLADEVLSRFLPEEEVRGLKRFHFVHTLIEGEQVLLSRTGYTGERGFEIFSNAGDIAKLWDAFLQQPEVKPAGLGARDILRLEMGYPLYGNDIDTTRNPVEAGLMRFVDTNKDFIGKQALPERGEYELRGFKTGSRRSARRSFKVMADGREVGEVTSAGYSPSLEEGIGLCYLRRDAAASAGEFQATDGKRNIKIYMAEIPFYDTNA